MLKEWIPVDHVVRGIHISGARATDHATELRRAEITHVLKLYEDIPYFPADFHTLQLAIDDGEPIPRETLKRGAAFVVEQVTAGRKVLVMCGAGISRSSTYVLASLLELGYQLPEAFQLLREQHRSASPHPVLWRSLLDHYGQLYSLAEVLDWSRD
jgi:protein-tyrosine phosphatase